MNDFHSLGISVPVVAALARHGVDAPFPVQSMVIPDALAGKDVLARSHTGSGKTLAFALPIAERLDPKGGKPSALVLVPTRELCSQVGEDVGVVANARGLRCATVYGGVSIGAQAKAAAQSHIVVATPGRLEDLAERKLIDLRGVRILILDEADRMLDMGFQPQVDRIVRRIPRDRQTMFFSATLDGGVGHMAHAYTRDAILHEASAEQETVDEAEHRFIPVEAGKKVEELVRLLREAERGLVLVFVRTKRGADRLVQKLRPHGVDAVAMHGDMTQQARERAFARFEAGKVNTLVATDVAARGLDLDDITHVVNFDPPADSKGYLHRVGRTARAGRTGTGVTFVQPEQQGDVSRMASRLKLEDAFQEEGMKVAPPRTVFSSKGRGARRRRR